MPDEDVIVQLKVKREFLGIVFKMLDTFGGNTMSVGLGPREVHGPHKEYEFPIRKDRELEVDYLKRYLMEHLFGGLRLVADMEAEDKIQTAIGAINIVPDIIDDKTIE